MFTAAAPKADTLDLLRNISNILNNTVLSDKLKRVSWHTNQHSFHIPGKFF